MAQSINEAFIRFAKQAHPQLRRIAECWTSYQADPSQIDAVSEARRVIHRLKGEASMIGLSGFSHVAFFLEESLQFVIEGETCSESLLAAIVQLNSALHKFVEELGVDETDAITVLKHAVIAYRRAKSLSEEGDRTELERIFGEHAPTTTAHRDHSAASVDSATMDSFRAEASDHLQLIADLLADDKPDDEELARIRRAMHCVKGAAGTLGLTPIADLAHTVEDLLDRLRAGDLEFSDELQQLVRNAVDALGDLVEEGHTSSDVASIRSALAEQLGSETNALALPAADVPPSMQVPAEAADVNQRTAQEVQEDLNRTVSPELLAVYAEEAEDHIKRLYSALNELRVTPDDRNSLQEVRRSAHTLKGAAGAVGLRVVTKLSHRMEDLLDQLYEGRRPLSDDNLALLLNTADCLHDLSSDRFDPDHITQVVVELYNGYNAALVAVGGITIPVVQSLSHDSASTVDEEGNQPKPRQATKQQDAARDTSGGQMLRVPIERVDDLVRTVSELIINRTTFEQRMSDFVRFVGELNPILARLRSVSHEIETRYSVDAMRGQRLPDSKAFFGLGSQIAGSRFAEFDALEFDRYNDFHLTARTIAEATADINTVTNEFRTLIGDFDSLLARQDRLSRDTQNRLMQIRMVPLATLATRLHRAVRVVATNQHKKVELVIEGETIELDKTVLEDLADPLLHLLRNAVDHGVEPSDLRVIQGKPETATIRIRAFYQGTQVVLRVSDDGAGIDHTRVATAAVKGGHLSSAEAETMTVQELLPYIFVPGLSTAERVSEISGRGVGMDIVRDKVQKLKGTISVDTEIGRGTVFTIRLPMTLAVTRALMVNTGGQSFAIPMQAVVQIARLERSAIHKLGSEPVIRLGDTACPLIHLSQHLGLPEIESDSRMIPVLIIRSGDKQIAVQIDKILAGRDIVVKTLGTHLRKVPGLIGATLLGDGTVVPILDPNTFVGSTSVSQPRIAGTTRRAISNDLTTTVMIVDDSVSVRRVMENLVLSQGWNAIVAKDGVDALELLRTHKVTPDVFLLDIEMPRMDGYELLGSLRSSEAYVNAPVVMVTSRSGEKHRQKAYALGATDYLVKPYQDDELISLIVRLTTKEPAHQ